MKLHKIIVLIFVLVLPLQVNNAVACSPGEEPGDFGCATCNRGTYNSTGTGQCQPCPDDYQNNWSGGTTNKQHIEGETDSQCQHWECVPGYIRSGDSCVDSCDVEEPKYLPSGAGCDDWLCRSPYYKNGNDCATCPTGSATTGDVATSISQCNCPQNYHKHYTNSPTFDYCFTCGTGAHYDSGTGSCVCDNQYANGTWTNNNGLRTYSCTCPEGSTPVDNTCTCSNPNYHITGTTDNYVCESCGSHQISQGGTCVCEERYYGNADGCIQCPSGTKVARANDLLPTNSTKANCRAHSGTKFCDANGQNCMKLLQ